jgi:poly(3-hydroxybutyrate) depolymerase
MIAFHRTDDRFTPYHGGTSWVARDHVFPAERNPSNLRSPTSPASSTRAVRTTRSVVLYTIRRGGHTWPGGRPMPEWFAGSTGTSVDASRQAWAFFQAHPLQRQ